ncbi:MAG: radical SAM protein [Candidatus Omnitrophica bacterium]|nr:radical SAM protein [Candidatus Omnitrophota bacterium]
MKNIFSELESEKKISGEKSYPTSCSLVVLNRCLLQCKMCHMWKAPRVDDEVTIEELKRFVSTVKDMLVGDKELIISGGEPLLKEGIFDLIRHASDRGLKTIMPTNGYLITEEVAKRLHVSGLKEIFISLDSNNPATHDFLRGKDGCFERVMKGIEYLHAYCRGLRINFLTVISNKNLHEVITLLHEIENDKRISGVYFQAIATPFFTGLGEDWCENEEFGCLWPHEYEKVVDVIDEIIHLKREKNYMVHNHHQHLELFKRYFKNPHCRVEKRGCYLGDSVINVDHVGNINLCCFDQPVGNIRTNDIQRLWFSDDVKGRQAVMHQCERNCHNLVNCFFKPR